MFSSTSIIPLQILSIEDDGLHLMIQAKVNSINCHLLLDTGASRTVFDKTQILKFIGPHELEEHDKLSTGLGTDSMPTSSANLIQFEIGEVVVSNFKAILLDLAHVNSSYEKMGFNTIDGVLGSDILFSYNAKINYKKLQLEISLKPRK